MPRGSARRRLLWTVPLVLLVVAAAIWGSTQAVVAAAVAAVAGALLLWRGHLGARYSERAAKAPAGSEGPDDEQLWRSLSRGEDPTDDA